MHPQTETKWLVRLSVRTSDFHSGKRGSTPLRATKKLTETMANHKSSIKRIRQSETKRVHNKYYARTTRNAMRKLNEVTDKAVAMEQLPIVVSMLDKLAKNNIIHKNKAANLKSQITKRINALA